MNIYQRINEVRKAVAYVKKDKKVDGGGYMAVTHDAVTALAREHLITHGVVIVPSLVSSAVQQTGTTTAKGVPFIRYEARYMFNVVNADEPQDKFSLEIESHAIDQGDKAPGKALSYAKKYAVLKLLEIESGEEEEEREHQKPKVTPNAGAGESLTSAQKEKVNRIAGEIIDWFEANNEENAFKVYEECGLDVEEKLFLWSFLGSKQRSTIKKMGEAKKGNGTKH
jgi:hypothetical protein